jgi:hypothetical protein
MHDGIAADSNDFRLQYNAVVLILTPICVAVDSRAFALYFAVQATLLHTKPRAGRSTVREYEFCCFSRALLGTSVGVQRVALISNSSKRRPY